MPSLPTPLARAVPRARKPRAGHRRDRAVRGMLLLIGLTGLVALALFVLALRLGPSAQRQRLPPAPPASPDSALARLVPPLRGFVSRGLEPGIAHFGVDVAVPPGTPVRAAAAGRVLLSDSTDAGGLTLVLAHAHALVTVYRHNARLLVHTGAPVAAGQTVALSGSTGRLTTGPHLHFEAWLDGRALDVRALVEDTVSVR